MVRLDRTRLDQAIINLTLNARDAMPDNGTLWSTPAGSVAAGELVGPKESESSAGEYLVISPRRRRQRDGRRNPPPGAGAVLHHQAGGAGNRPGAGMAYGFVRQSGGTLAHREREAEGGRSVSLYLLSTASEVADSEPRPRPRGCGAVLRARGEHVMVVDDEPSVGETMRRALEEAGIRVVEARRRRTPWLGSTGDREGSIWWSAISHAAHERRKLGRAIGDRWPGLAGPLCLGVPGCRRGRRGHDARRSAVPQKAFLTGSPGRASAGPAGQPRRAGRRERP